MKLCFWRKDPEPAPAENEPLWVEIDRILAAAGVPRLTRKVISLRVDNAVLRQELHSSKMETLRARTEVNMAAPMVHNPRPVRPMSTPIRRKRQQQKWARQKRNQRAKLKLVHPTEDADAS
jgi:hypothetical protein